MVHLEQADLNAPLISAMGGPVVKGEKNDTPFTLRDLLIVSANHPMGDESMSDMMRLYRLQEKLSPNGKEAVELHETDIDDLREHGHLRWKDNIWLDGKLLTLLSREDTVMALKEAPNAKQA